MKRFIIIMILFFITYIPLYYIASDSLRKFIDRRFVAYVVLTTLAGIYAPNIEIYFAAIVLLFMMTVRGRIDTAGRYILLAAIVPQIQWSIGSIGHYFGAIDSAGAIGAAGYIVAKWDKSSSPARPGRGWTPEDVLVVTIFLIMAVGGAGFDKFTDTLRAWLLQFMLIVMPYILFRATLKSTADFRAAIACFGAASLFLGVFAIYEARMSANIFDIITHHLTGLYVTRMDIRGGTLRASATMGGPLALACFMTIGVFALACSRDFFRNAFGYYASLVVAFLGLLATQSRGSLVAVLASAVVLSVGFRKWAYAAAATVVATAAWPVLQVVAQSSPAVASFINGGAATHSGKYYDYRNLLLERGLAVAANHPITGMRMTQVLDALADISQGQGIVDLVNVYLVILLISGLVGLVPFLSLTLISGARAMFGFGSIRDQAFLRARAFALATFAVVLIQLSFVSFIDRMPMMFVLTVFGIRLLVQERRRLRAGAGRRTDFGPASVSAADGARDGEMPPQPAPDADTPWQPRLPMISA